jgi:hypothetical protein
MSEWTSEELSKIETAVEPATVGEAIDAAYRAKYRRYPASIVDSVLTREARAATLELVPNDQ